MRNQTFFYFLKLWRWDLVSRGNQFFKVAGLLVCPYYFSIWKIETILISCGWQHFDKCEMMELAFFWAFQNSFKLGRGGDLVSWGDQFCKITELFGPPTASRFHFIDKISVNFLRSFKPFFGFCKPLKLCWRDLVSFWEPSLWKS